LEAAVFQDLSVSGAKASHISKITIFGFVLIFGAYLMFLLVA
jgi:hypothetical protein